MNWKMALSLLVITAYLSACSGKSVNVQLPIAKNPTAETTALTPSLNPPVVTRMISPQPTAIPPAQMVPVWKVSPNPTNYNFGWMADKNILLYTNSDSAEIWLYDVAIQKSEPYQKDFPWQPDAGTLAKLPPNVHAVEASPSGVKLLYTIPDPDRPSPYPVDGTTGYKQQFAKLWLFNGQEARPIGDIEDCIGGYIWSANEQRAVILPDSPPGKCETAESWILDIETGYLAPWLIKSDYDRSISITDVSDDGSAILFGTPQGSLYIRNLSDNTDTLVLSRPGSGVKGAWLHDGQKLLVQETSLGSLTTQLLIYREGEASPQKIEIAPPDLFVSHWRLSPDRKWLAFLTEKRDEFQSNGLWVADLRSVQ